MRILKVFALGLATVALSDGAWAEPPPAALPSMAALVDSVKAAVVNVDVQARVGREGDGAAPLGDVFGRRVPEQIRQGAGSGVIIDPKGLILTNHHVVQGAIAIRVRLDDGRTFEGQVLGRDPLTDLALIQLKGKVEKLPSVKLGDSSAVKVGDWVVAIGNPYGLASSVSVGILSGRARDIHAGPYDDFLQTDAAINPGNSGGPLFNTKGEVVGINTAIAGVGTGIGFAVPSNLAKAILPQLQQDGKVTRGWLGVAIQDLTPELGRALGVPVQEGALVPHVNPNSPAQKAGLRPEDVVVALDGAPIASGGALSRAVALKRPGSQVVVSLYRGGERLELDATLGTRPDLEGIGELKRERPESREDAAKQRIGVVVQDVNPRAAREHGWPSQGALITDVAPGSIAERAELRAGMVVVEAARKAVRNADDLLKALHARSGTTVLLRVRIPGASGDQLRALVIP